MCVRKAQAARANNQPARGTVHSVDNAPALLIGRSFALSGRLSSCSATVRNARHVV